MVGKLFYFFEDSVKNCYLFFCKWLLGVSGKASGLGFFFVSSFVVTNSISPFVRGLFTLSIFNQLCYCLSKDPFHLLFCFWNASVTEFFIIDFININWTVVCPLSFIILIFRAFPLFILVNLATAFLHFLKESAFSVSDFLYYVPVVSAPLRIMSFLLFYF